MRNFFAVHVALAVFVCLLLVVLGTGLMTLMTWSLPNQLRLPPVEDLLLYRALWDANPGETLRLLLFDRPLLAIARFDARAATEVWGIYYYPLPMLVYLGVSGYAMRQARLSDFARPPGRLLVGLALVLFSVSYVRLASCCTGGPQWAAEVMLLALAFDPAAESTFWFDFYVRTEPWHLWVQVGCLLGGLLIVYLNRDRRTRARGGKCGARCGVTGKQQPMGYTPALCLTMDAVS